MTCITACPDMTLLVDWAYERNERTTAGEADKIEQPWRNVLTDTTTHKEQLKTQALPTHSQSLSGVRREIGNNKRRRQERRR